MPTRQSATDGRTHPLTQPHTNGRITIHVSPPMLLRGDNKIYLYNYMFCQQQSPTRHAFVKHGCPRRQQSQNMAKISKSYIMTSPHPPGHGMSVKCEEPLDELTVKVWLLYLHLNFNYWTLSVSGTELRTDGQTNRRTDRRSDY